MGDTQRKRLLIEYATEAPCSLCHCRGGTWRHHGGRVLVDQFWGWTRRWLRYGHGHGEWVRPPRWHGYGKWVRLGHRQWIWLRRWIRLGEWLGLSADPSRDGASDGRLQAPDVA